MAIKIITDASADISLKDAEKLGIEIIPMPVIIDQVEYLAGLNLDDQQFYQILKTAQEFPKTSQLTPLVYLKYYKEAKLNNHELLVITLSSGLSGSYQSSVIAKTMIDYQDIYLVDSLSASIGMRLLVELACKLRDQGNKIDQIYHELEEIKTKIKMVAMVDTLEYLAKGGRINRAQAMIGNLLNIKPIISFENDGKLSVVEKSIGKTRAIKEMLKIISQNSGDPKYPCYYVYSGYQVDTLKLAQKVNLLYQIDQPINCYQIGPVIGAHVGPGAIGIIYVKK